MLPSSYSLLPYLFFLTYRYHNATCNRNLDLALNALVCYALRSGDTDGEDLHAPLYMPLAKDNRGVRLTNAEWSLTSEFLDASFIHNFRPSPRNIGATQVGNLVYD